MILKTVANASLQPQFREQIIYAKCFPMIKSYGISSITLTTPQG